jgi:hypothetical protein
MTRVKLSIDTLVLRGFPREDRHAIARGLREELTRLLSEPGMASDLQRLPGAPLMKLPHITLGPALKPRSVGEHVGRAIGRRLKS